MKMLYLSPNSKFGPHHHSSSCCISHLDILWFEKVQHELKLLMLLQPSLIYCTGDYLLYRLFLLASHLSVVLSFPSKSLSSSISDGISTFYQKSSLITFCYSLSDWQIVRFQSFSSLRYIPVLIKISSVIEICMRSLLFCFNRHLFQFISPNYFTRHELSGANNYSLIKVSNPFIFKPVTFCLILETLKSLAILTEHFKMCMALKLPPVNATAWAADRGGCRVPVRYGWFLRTDVSNIHSF